MSRVNAYLDWIKILGPDGNYNETKVLCDFAKKHNIQGYILDTLSPDMVSVFNEC